MYSLNCNFPLLNTKSSGMRQRRLCFSKGALGETILQRDLPRRRLSWTDDDVRRLLPLRYVKRESCAIRISACYDKSGSSEKKKVLFYRFVGLSLSFSVHFFVWRFCCDSGALFEGGKWDERLTGWGGGDCVTTRFLVGFL